MRLPNVLVRDTVLERKQEPGGARGDLAAGTIVYASSADLASPKPPPKLDKAWVGGAAAKASPSETPRIASADPPRL
jgi:hypothetical protein